MLNFRNRVFKVFIQGFRSMSEKTFGYQNSLPNLPVPPLQQTIDKYLDSVKPHVTKEEFEETKKKAFNFVNNEGSILQNALIEKSRQERNWVEKWWETYTYLIWRTPLIPLSNFGGSSTQFDVWPPKIGTGNERAALITYWTLKYWEALKNETLPVQRSRKDILDMNQSHCLFNSCRLPGEHIDSFERHFMTNSEGVASDFVVIMYGGNFWKLNIYTASHKLLTPPALKKAFDRVTIYGHQRVPSNIGALTCTNRTTWWKNKTYLEELSPLNKNHLEAIEKCILILSFSDETPESDTELAFYSTAGNSKNQFADKGFVWHFFKNGTHCTTAEHGNMDAITMVLLNMFVDENLKAEDFSWKGTNENTENLALSEMDFVIDPRVNRAVEDAIREFETYKNDLDIQIFTFDKFGMKFLKEQKVYGDTIVQLALQLAYFRLHNKFAPTYETATTRRFYHGRTETVRSCTPESCHFCEIVLKPGNSTRQIKDAFLAAMEKHNRLMMEAMNGQGCDRHLLGLRILAMQSGLPAPAIFEDPAWKKSGGDGNFILSTSFAGYSSAIGGVCPMCDDGYGCFYVILPEKIKFYTSVWKKSKETNLKLWLESLQWSLSQFGKILTAESKI